MEDRHNAFTRAATEGDSRLLPEFWAFLRENKKWWLLPILVCLVGLGLLIVLAGSAAAPFIYTLF